MIWNIQFRSSNAVGLTSADLALGLRIFCVEDPKPDKKCVLLPEFQDSSGKFFGLKLLRILLL